MKSYGHRALLENCQVSEGKCLKLLPISCNSPACELSLSRFKRDWLQGVQLAEASTLQGLSQASSQGHTLLTTSAHCWVCWEFKDWSFLLVLASLYDTLHWSSVVGWGLSQSYAALCRSSCQLCFLPFPFSIWWEVSPCLLLLFLFFS